MVRGSRRGKADKAEEIPAPAPAPAPKKSAAPKKAIKAKEEAAAEKVAEEAPKEVAVAPAPIVEPAKEDAKPAAAVEETPEEEDPNAVWSPNDADVLSGRGASVNSHGVSSDTTLYRIKAGRLAQSSNHLFVLRLSF